MNTSSLRGYAWAAAATVCATLAALALLPYVALTNIVMLFLLAVMVVAFKLGRGPAIAATIFNLAAFDFFCVPPRFSFAVADVQYLVTFAVMLAVGLVVAHLASSLRRQAEMAAGRERRAHDLYEMARVLSGALTEEQVADAASRFLAQSFGARAALLVRNRSGGLWAPEIAGQRALDQVDNAVAQAVFQHPEDKAAWKVAAGSMYLPLKAPLRTRGVLIVKPPEPGAFEHPEQARHIQTYAVLIAIALERVHFVTVAREATVQMEGERLRNSVLAALSHDLRTPLTAILGSAESLLLDAGTLSSEQTVAIDAIRGQTRRTCELVENILDMARLESGSVRLREDWQPLEEIVGAAIKARESELGQRAVTVVSPPNLPLVECDAVLIERVLVNLLENAAKYTPAGSPVRISMRVAGDQARIDVQDNGPGVPPGTEETIFEKFARGRVQPSVPGLGLGLALCRAIVEAHGGRIWVEAALGGGADFAFTLPLGTPPAVEAEMADVR